LRGVAAEECAVLPQVCRGGFAAVNIDWPQVRDYLPEQGLTVATFGWSEAADLRISETHYDAPWLHFTLNDRFHYRLQLPGAHNAVNAAAAVTIARRWGFEQQEIAQRLESFVALPMRTQVLEFGGIAVINDAYNANPDSMRAGLQALAVMARQQQKRSWAILGEMGELGDESITEHDRVGRLAVRLDISRLVVVGTGRPMSAMHHGAVMEGSWGSESTMVPDTEAALALLRAELQPGDVVLVKSSNAAGLGALAEALMAQDESG
jgi:UDP-N-acetylmuramoyl-tripeptide--D-alanyl-D-alanine ligase